MHWTFAMNTYTSRRCDRTLQPVTCLTRNLICSMQSAFSLGTYAMCVWATAEAQSKQKRWKLGRNNVIHDHLWLFMRSSRSGAGSVRSRLNWSVEIEDVRASWSHARDTKSLLREGNTPHPDISHTLRLQNFREHGCRGCVEDWLESRLDRCNWCTGFCRYSV